MISHPWRRQGCCSSCIRFRTASRDRCVAVRVMRFPIRLTSFPYNDSFLEYHTECKCVGHLCTQPLIATGAGAMEVTTMSQGDREGRPYNTRLPVLHVNVYCRGDRAGRPI